MITKQASLLAATVALLLTGIAGCAKGHRPSGAGSESSAPAPGSTVAESSPPALKPAATAPDAAQQFAQALARGKAELACGLADAQLRATAPGISCATAFAELAVDDRYVFTQAACINSATNYKVDGDPQDNAESVRVNIDCAEGYTWLRVNRIGSIWRVVDINTP